MSFNDNNDSANYPFGSERIVIWFDNPLESPVGFAEGALPCKGKIIDKAYVPGTSRLASVVLLPLTEAEVQEIREVAAKQGTATWIRSGENYVSRWQSGHHQH